MAEGPNYWDHISEEIPRVARSFFPLSDAREDNFVAGLSMGGYGAFKLGFLCPEKFCAAASLSGALDIDWLNTARPGEARRIFGETASFAGSPHDPVRMLDDLCRSDRPKPKLFQCCGTEDFLYNANQRFRSAAAAKAIDFTYAEQPGMHCWEFWDHTIQDVLRWLPLAGRPQGNGT
jgi:S-formylglutathione hydrolase FrmB